MLSAALYITSAAGNAMAYVLTRFGIPFLSSLPISAAPDKFNRLADAVAQLDRLSLIDRRQILESELWNSLRPKQRPDYGSRLFAVLRPKVVPRWNGGDVEKGIVWLVAGDEGDSSFPDVLLKKPWRRILEPPSPQKISSSDNTLARLDKIPKIGRDLARAYAQRIVEASEQEGVSPHTLARARKFLSATDTTSDKLSDRESPPGDTLLLEPAKDLFDMALFDPLDDSSSPEWDHLILLSELFIKQLQDATPMNFADKVLSLTRQEGLEKEAVFREYLLKVAAVHLIRFPSEERDLVQKLLQTIFDELKTSGSENQISIDSLPEEVMSVLQWVRIFSPDHPALEFLQRIGGGGEKELLGASGLLELPADLVGLLIGGSAADALKPPSVEKYFPEVGELRELPNGLSFYLPDPKSGKLKRADLNFGRAWAFTSGGMGVLYLVERKRRPSVTAPLEPLLLVAKTIRPDEGRSLERRAEMRNDFLREADFGEILGGHPHILSVQQVAWNEQEDPVAILRYLSPWKVEQDEETITVNTLLNLIYSRLEYSLDLVLDRILMPAAQALVFAHKKGVGHNDLKPSNLFVEKREGEEWPHGVVADWGMAELLRQEGFRREGLRGTPGYFFRRELHGPVRDVRAFGIMAYEAIARRHPAATTADYAGTASNNVLLMLAPWEDQVRPVRDFVSEIPRELEGWIYRTMGYSKSEQREQFGLADDEVDKPYTLMEEVLGGLEHFIRLDQARQSVQNKLANIQNATTHFTNQERFPRLKMTRAQFDAFRASALAVHAEYEHVLLRLGNIDPKVIRGHQELLWRLYEEAEVFGLEMEIEPLLSRYETLKSRTQERGSLSIFLVGVDIDAIRLDCVRLKMGSDNIFHEENLWKNQSLVESDLRLPKGVYYLRLRAEGFVPIQLPVTVRRGIHRDIPVPFYREDAIPKGFAVIPGGKVIVEEYPDSYWMQTDRVEKVKPFAVSQTMVTNAQYIEFLNALIRDGKEEEAMSHLPSNAKGTPLWHQKVLAGIRDRNPISEPIHFADGDPVLLNAPVVWIRAGSAKDWMEWKSGGKWKFRFPTRREMLFLMRGTDARLRPWGDNVLPGHANVKPVRWSSEGTAISPLDVTAVGKYPRDVSPVSHPDRPVHDVFGNARKITNDTDKGDVRYSMGAAYNVDIGSMVQSDPYFERIHYSHGFFVVAELESPK